MDEPANIGSDLQQTKKESPFGVPEGYFQDFPERLQKRIQIPISNQRKVRTLSTVKPYLAAAIIIIVALLTGNYFLGSIRDKHTAKLFQNEISQVVEQELYSISEETILEVMDPGSLSNDSLVSPVMDEDMINYLLNENVNEAELLNAL